MVFCLHHCSVLTLRKSSHPIPMNANHQLAVISNFPKVLSSLFPAHRSRKTSCGRRGLRTKSGANSSPARYRAGVGWRGTDCPAGRRPKTGGAWGTFRRGISPPSQTDHPVAAQCRAGKLPDLHASGRAGAVRPGFPPPEEKPAHPAYCCGAVKAHFIAPYPPIESPII